MKLSRSLGILIKEQKLNTGVPPTHESKLPQQQPSEKSELVSDRTPREIVVQGGGR
jgi:hypothetical protein